MSPSDDTGAGDGPTGPLAGILVADFSRVLAGPLATMFLADLGATVVKVERPDGGDDTRSWGPPYVEGMSTYFASVNRNKRSLRLDLASPDDLGLARRLVERADVAIENMRPGRLAELGVDFTSYTETNPRLVSCSISGFGSGAGRDLAGYDFLVQALGGLMSITGPEGGAPTKVGVALVDVLTGLHATIAVLAALHEREQSGRGQHVEVNLLSSLLSSLVNQGSGFINGAAIPAAMGNRHPSIAPYETLATQDGPIAVAIGNDRQFAKFVSVLECPGLATDARFRTNYDRVLHREELVVLLESSLRSASVDSWSKKLQAAGLPCGPVQSIDRALELAEQLGLSPIVDLESDSGILSSLSNPITLLRTPATYYKAPPMLGADDQDLRRWLASGIAGIPT